MPVKRFFRMLFVCLSVCLVLIGCSSEEEKKPAESAAVPSNMPAPGPVKPETRPVETKGDTAITGEVIVLKPALWKTLTKPPVRFTHEKHIKTHGIACVKCHHVYEQGKNIWTQDMSVAKCASCHNEPTVKGETKLPDDEKKRNLKLAFHGNCRTCHKKVKKENAETTAPVSCNQCHKKENGDIR